MSANQSTDQSVPVSLGDRGHDGQSVGANRRWASLAIVASGMFMANLDTTIVNVALGKISREFGVSVASLMWVVNGYTLSFAALILLGGAATDRYGARRVYLTGLALFVAASIACGAASNIAALVAARVVQGVGAAFFLPASLALVRFIFEEPGARARAVAWWATIATIAFALGPVLGGALVDTWGWRSAFWINAPVGAAGFFLTLRALPPTAGNPSRTFDTPGQLLTIVALGGLCNGVTQGTLNSLASPWAWGSLVVAGLAAAALVVVERRSSHPMIPLQWFSNRIFSSMVAAGSLVFFGFFGVLFSLSLYMQEALHIEPHIVGTRLLPLALSLSAGNFLSERLIGSVDRAWLMATGLILAALTLPAAVWAMTAGLNPFVSMTAFFFFGAGASVSVAPTIATVLEQAPAAHAGVASGLLNAARQSGSLLGVAVASVAIALVSPMSAALWVVVACCSGALIAGSLLALASHPVK